jgi:hypothetical protein
VEGHLMACSFNKKGNYIAEEKTQLAVLLVGWDQNSIRMRTHMHRTVRQKGVWVELDSNKTSYFWKTSIHIISHHQQKDSRLRKLSYRTPYLMTYLTSNVSFLIAPMLDTLSVSILQNQTPTIQESARPKYIWKK